MKLEAIIDNYESIYFGNLHKCVLVEDIELATEVQTVLSKVGLYHFSIDGIFGSISQVALQDFIETEGLSQDYVLDDVLAELLLERVKKTDNKLCRDFGDSREDFVEATIELCYKHGLPLKEQMAYVLATAEHETGGTFKPVIEAYWLSESWRKKNLWYYPYHGRGYVQITHKYNYEKFSKLLDMDLVKNPDDVLDKKISLFILVYGMSVGLFSGKRLGSYVNKGDSDFKRARKVVNGRDKASHISSLADAWLIKLINREENMIESKSIGLTPEMAQRYKRLR